MAGLDTYILSVTAGAILCAMASQLADSKGIIGRLTKLICGVIMTAVVVRPLGNAALPDFTAYFVDMEAQITEVVNTAVMDSRKQLSQRITEETRAYILDKAASLGASVEVTVVLDDGNPPVPVGVVLSGTAAPGVRAALTEIIASDLGVRKEDQIWK